jgi:hypothetical protein
MHRRTRERSAIEPAWLVKGDARMSSPTTSYCRSSKLRARAFPQVPGTSRNQHLHDAVISISSKSHTKSGKKPLFILELLGVEFGASPGFPVGVGGAGELHAAFLDESRTTRSVQCSEAGNPVTAIVADYGDEL